MERMKTISMLCILLACVAPAMAADYVIPNGSFTTFAAAPFMEYTYNATPDAQAVADWQAGNIIPTTDGYGTAPYYTVSETALPAGVYPGANDAVHLMHSTPGGFALNFNSAAPTNNASAPNQIGALYAGDSYWPADQAYTKIGTTQPVIWNNTAIISGGGHIAPTLINYGRNPGEYPMASQLGVYNAVADETTYPINSYASNSRWNFRNGTIQTQTIRVTNTNTDNVGKTGDTWGATRNVIDNQQPSRGNTNNPLLKVGNIELNKTALIIVLNQGRFELEGTVGLAQGAEFGNFAFILGDRLNETVSSGGLYDPVMKLKWSELTKWIDNGWLFAPQLYADQQANLGNPRYDANGHLITGTVSTDPTYIGPKITRGVDAPGTGMDMTRWLDVTWVGGSYEASGGYVEVRKSESSAIVIPEPATLVLLGLGSVVAAFRRKR